MDIFAGQTSIGEVLSLPVPLLDDLFDAKLKYLEEKRKAEKDAMDAANRAAEQANRAAAKKKR